MDRNTEHHGEIVSAGFFEGHGKIRIAVMSGESGPDNAKRPDVYLSITSGVLNLSYSLHPEAARQLATSLAKAADAASFAPAEDEVEHARRAA